MELNKDSQKLLEPVKVNGIEINNRLVVAPMVCFGYADEGNFVSDRNVTHYENMAEGGSGLIIVEATCICKNGKLNAKQLGIWDDKFIDGLSKISKAIHKHGVACVLQIHHAGIKTIDGEPIAPSDYNDGKQSARGMSLDDIRDVTEKFAAAARRAKIAGYDGVEIHSCHGYLINQFLSPEVNKRTDEYGIQKSKFGVDIIKAVREAVGDGFIIGVRTPGNVPDVKTSAEYAKAYETAGADYISVSYGLTKDKPDDLEFDESSGFSFVTAMGSQIRKSLTVPVMVVYGVNTINMAMELLNKDKADFVAVGRGFIVDCRWIKKLKTGEPIDKCLSCPTCQTYKSPEMCVKRVEKRTKA